MAVTAGGRVVDIATGVLVGRVPPFIVRTCT